jgi:hypothetical protein
MSDKRNGPLLRIEASCNGCEFETHQRYSVQGDSGCDVYCTHPAAPKSDVGDSTWKTPEWCPLLSVAITKLLARSE